MGPEFLTTGQLAELLGLAPQSLRAWRLRGEGPDYAKLGGRSGRVLYRRSDVDAWLQSRTVRSTAAASARDQG